MKCDRAKDLFSDVLEKSAPEAIATDFDSHLSACQDCALEYKSFATVFAALESGFVEVDPPAQFRDQVMTRLRDQTLRMERESKGATLSFWRRMISPKGIPTFVTRSAIAAAAGLVVLGILIIPKHNTSTHSSTSSVISIPRATVSAPSQSFFRAITQKTLPDGSIQTEATLEIPGTGTASSPASLYVIQSADAITDPTALNDPTKATPIWTGTLQTGTTTEIPVSVSSGAPIGTTLTLLAVTTPQAGNPGKTEVVYIPITGTVPGYGVVPAGSNLHQAASAISGGFGVQITFDETCFAPTPALAPLGTLDKTVTDPKVALNDVFGSAGYQIKSLGSSTFIVSKPAL